MTMTILANLAPLLLLLLLPSATQGADRPHIVVLMADDMGWTDVGFRDPEMATPVIDRLASEGVLLNQSYMLKSCTPSRSTMLTGNYAFRMGLQDSSLYAQGNDSVSLDKRFFPQDLQDAGYSTHYVGKWHLGFCRKEMTPTYRGFDTFYGKYNGEGDYYDHTSKMNGYDLQDIKGDNFTVDWSANGTYSTELFTDKAVEIINAHNASRPLFLFLSYQAVHGPLQVPDSYVTKYCANVTAGLNATTEPEKVERRKRHCAMAAAMDEGIGKVVAALKTKGLDDDLILYFTSDNGGPVKLGSSNWPLRGSKITEWEGGTRVISFLHSKKYLPNAPYVWEGMIHAVDWYPTLLRAAGIKVNTSNMDGIDSWNRIVKNLKSERTEFVYNLNEVKENYSLRWKKYKLVSFKKPSPNGWYNPPPGQGIETESTEPRKEYMLFDLSKDPSEQKNLIKSKSGQRKFECVVELMKLKIKIYKEGVVPARPKDKLAIADPAFFGGAWSTGWC